MPVLDFHSAILVYADADAATTNPQRRYVDWQRHLSGITCENPISREYQVGPGASITAFSGTRSTSVDGTTAFALTLNPTLSGTYRMTATGGTAPAFRTLRSYDPNGVALTLAVNNNATLTISQGAGNFNAQVGDTVFIPGVSTGDAAGPFNVLNEGEWTVIAASALKLTLVRPVGEQFVGVAEAVTPLSTGKLKIYSAAGVQAGDNLEISAGFSTVTQKSFVVSRVTDTWVEFVSAEALPLETGVLPTSSGVVFYSDARNFVCVEVDQEAVVQLNGDTGSSNRLSPLLAGDPDNVATFIKRGPCWQLVVVNRSQTATMTVNLISAE